MSDKKMNLTENYVDGVKKVADAASGRASGPNTRLAWFSNLRTPVKWMIYALAGILLLTIVQSIGGTDKLTSAPISREMLRWALPVLLAGLGGLFAERAGVVNIGLEGMMILGMWFGAWGALEFGAWGGLVVGVLGGAIGGLLHAVATVTFGVDQIISGVAINILAPAGTRYLSQEVWNSPTQSPRTPGIGDWDVPFLAGGSIFGWESPDILLTIAKWEWWFISDIADFSRGLLRGTSLLAMLAVALVPFSAWVLWRTRFGLRLRISGESPQAGEAQGINIYKYKYIAVIVSGALAGLGGVVISSPELSGQFLEGNSGGRGFIGLAALIFGNWRPLGVLLGALLYGYVFGLDLKDLDGTASHALLLLNAIALSAVAAWAISRQRIGDGILAGLMAFLGLVWWLASDTVPGWWSNILPYVVVLLVLVFFAQRLRVPAALGVPYRRGE
jgi:simple sugar transport system permease protein